MKTIKIIVTVTEAEDKPANLDTIIEAIKEGLDAYGIYDYILMQQFEEPT